MLMRRAPGYLAYGAGNYVGALGYLGEEEEPDIAPETFPPGVHSPAQIKAYADMLSELLLREERNSLVACKRLHAGRKRRCKQRVTNRMNRQRKRLTGAVLHAMRRALGGGFVTWAQGTASAVAQAASGFNPMPPGAFSMPAQTPPGYRPPPPSAEERRLLSGGGPPWLLPVAIGGGAILIITIVAFAFKKPRAMAANWRLR